MRGRKEDLLGQRFGRLVVIGESGRTKCRSVLWKCLCDCGQEIQVAAADLKRANTTSCGCYGRERCKETFTTHGLSTHPLYSIWNTMMDRCFDKNSKNYANYGNRGITVCTDWLSVVNFIKDMATLYKKGMQIDRIDNNGNYCPENCRWVTCKENQRNRRSNHILTYKGAAKTIIEWSEILGIGSTTLRGRLQKGWTVEQTLETPVRPMKLSRHSKLDNRIET